MNVWNVIKIHKQGKNHTFSLKFVHRFVTVVDLLQIISLHSFLSSIFASQLTSLICVLQLGQPTSSGEAEPSSHTPGRPTTGRAHGQTGWLWASARS